MYLQVTTTDSRGGFRKRRIQVFDPVYCLEEKQRQLFANKLLLLTTDHEITVKSRVRDVFVVLTKSFIYRKGINCSKSVWSRLQHFRFSHLPILLLSCWYPFSFCKLKSSELNFPKLFSSFVCLYLKTIFPRNIAWTRGCHAPVRMTSDLARDGQIWRESRDPCLGHIKNAALGKCQQLLNFAVEQN